MKHYFGFLNKKNVVVVKKTTFFSLFVILFLGEETERIIRVIEIFKQQVFLVYIMFCSCSSFSFCSHSSLYSSSFSYFFYYSVLFLCSPSLFSF